MVISIHAHWSLDFSFLPNSQLVLVLKGIKSYRYNSLKSRIKESSCKEFPTSGWGGPSEGTDAELGNMVRLHRCVATEKRKGNSEPKRNAIKSKIGCLIYF
jgi:hypothetical protein